MIQTNTWYFGRSWEWGKGEPISLAHLYIKGEWSFLCKRWGQNRKCLVTCWLKWLSRPLSNTSGCPSRKGNQLSHGSGGWASQNGLKFQSPLKKLGCHFENCPLPNTASAAAASASPQSYPTFTTYWSLHLPSDSLSSSQIVCFLPFLSCKYAFSHLFQPFRPYHLLSHLLCHQLTSIVPYFFTSTPYFLFKSHILLIKGAFSIFFYINVLFLIFFCLLDLIPPISPPLLPILISQR